jgi:membrane protein required for colicin V production
MNLSNLNYFDWFLIVILTWSTITAFLRGFLLELFALGGLVAGILIASWNYPVLAGVLEHIVTAKTVANVVAFLLIAVAVMILSAVIGKALHHTADAIGLGFFDRIFGAVFGYLRGCLLCVAILMAVTAFLPPAPAVAKSSLSPYFLAGAHAVSFVVPHDLRQQLLDGAERLKHTAPDWIKRHE